MTLPYKIQKCHFEWQTVFSIHSCQWTRFREHITGFIFPPMWNGCPMHLDYLVYADSATKQHKTYECVSHLMHTLHQTVSNFIISWIPAKHTHPFNGPFPRLPRWASTREVKPIWILLKQQTASGSGISWAICKSAPLSRQITTPAPHHASFLQAGCPSCRPTNSVKALKAQAEHGDENNIKSVSAQKVNTFTSFNNSFYEVYVVVLQNNWLLKTNPLFCEK